MLNREFIDSSDDVEKIMAEQNEITVLDESIPSPAEIQTDEAIVLPEIISMPEYIRRHYEKDLICVCINQIYDLTLCVMYDSKQLLVLDRNISTLNSFINHHYMATLNKCAVLPMESIPPDRSSIQIFELTKLMLCESKNTYEKLVSLYSSLNGMHCNVGLILQSDGKGVHIYLATCCNDEGISSALLKSSVLGHFPGSELSELDDDTVNRIMQSIQKMLAPAVGGRKKEQKYIRSVSIVPSRREDEKENHDLQLSAQGIEKLIDGMSGHQYTVLILAEPMDPESIDNCKRGYESLFMLLSPFAKETVSYGENESDTTNYSMSVNMSETISEGISESYGTSHTTGKSGGRGGNSGSSANGNGFGFSSGSCWNSGWNTSDSTSINKGKNTNTRTMNL